MKSFFYHDSVEYPKGSKFLYGFESLHAGSYSLLYEEKPRFRSIYEVNGLDPHFLYFPHSCFLFNYLKHVDTDGYRGSRFHFQSMQIAFSLNSFESKEQAMFYLPIINYQNDYQMCFGKDFVKNISDIVFNSPFELANHCISYFWQSQFDLSAKKFEEWKAATKETIFMALSNGGPFRIKGQQLADFRKIDNE